MSDDLDQTIERLVARSGPPFHDLPPKHGLVASLMRVLGVPLHTHYYERLDGSRVLLTSEEAAGIAPIELEMWSKKVARRMMRDRRTLAREG